MSTTDNISPRDSLHSPDRLFPFIEESSELTVACAPADFSASRIARAIEDCDAHLVNLNVTSDTLPTGEVTVALRAALRNPDSAARALERYGYRVIAVHDAAPADVDTLQDRVSQLLTHLEL